MSRKELVSRARSLAGVGTSAAHDTQVEVMQLHALFEQIGELLEEAMEGE